MLALHQSTMSLTFSLCGRWTDISPLKHFPWTIFPGYFLSSRIREGQQHWKCTNTVTQTRAAAGCPWGICTKCTRKCPEKYPTFLRLCSLLLFPCRQPVFEGVCHLLALYTANLCTEYMMLRFIHSKFKNEQHSFQKSGQNQRKRYHCIRHS